MGEGRRNISGVKTSRPSKRTHRAGHSNIEIASADAVPLSWLLVGKAWNTSNSSSFSMKNALILCSSSLMTASNCFPVGSARAHKALKTLVADLTRCASNMDCLQETKVRGIEALNYQPAKAFTAPLLPPAPPPGALGLLLHVKGCSHPHHGAYR